jgi:hypothetical protein
MIGTVLKTIFGLVLTIGFIILGGLTLFYAFGTIAFVASAAGHFVKGIWLSVFGGNLDDANTHIALSKERLSEVPLSFLGLEKLIKN